MPKTIEQKIALRERCNFLLDSVVNLNISLYPELRYIQNLWALGIIDTRYVQNEGNFVIDKFSEELFNMITTMSFLEIGRKYGVTDNTIRKWCKDYDLPSTKRDLKNII